MKDIRFTIRLSKNENDMLDDLYHHLNKRSLNALGLEPKEENYKFTKSDIFRQLISLEYNRRIDHFINV